KGIMNYEILEALGQIAREKNVGKELVIETLEAGIVSAARRKYGPNADIRVKFDEKSATMEVQYVRKVVDDLSDEEREIEFDDARSVNPKVKIGEELIVPLSFEEFGRGAIQAAKQVVVQRVREAERENVYQNYHNRIGEIVTGTVQQINRGNIIVNLGRAESLLPFREQIRREQYRQGDTIRALIIDVQKNTKGPQIILSRASEDFLVKLFQQEVPEILEGIVQIKAVAREAGGRSKIGVASNEYRVDPVGACVGMKGSRVQGIVRELSGERIDIVPYSEDPIAFVTKALSPAKILQTIPDEENKTMKVVVTEDQLSLAIGKGGQNARLAAKLTGWKIDLVSESEFAASRGGTSRAQAISVSELSGLGPKTLENLVQAGFETVQDIVKASIEDLINVPGVGDVTSQKIYLAAVQHMEAVEEKKKRDAQAAPAAAVPVPAAAAVAEPEFEIMLPPPAPAKAPAPVIAVDEEAAIEPPPIERVAERAKEERVKEVKEEQVIEERPKEREKKPEPVAAEKGDVPGNYLDDIAAMESELSSGWEDEEAEPNQP
ncbi:MAG TPA: transcription termination factor NusA, partial [bacterium]|nr:transcription termination factor NusA [bacterium]